ncbi:DUF4183 domain-containing protein [Alkaliphilus oremlandii]|uniref:DUF4183 domain-containing protein n=1 Tax=Alkaliphilus oremlandii (strain OhILAs) TaxID=350688 RepID=A8MM02_ALKOO|nr:DUF4183 domain-containing protein [Alkaliphilus oremlandii]ABW18169.1 conserved hypothetical protein [Alkaliphilus oremlandii OhILAs]
MATKLFKLVVDAVTTTDTDIHPEVENYFYELSETERSGSTVTIPSTLFTDSEGTAVTGNLTTAAANNGYYLLFINGVLQQSSLYTVSVDGSEVVITNADSILVGTPITLVVNNFVPDSDSTTTVTT